MQSFMFSFNQELWPESAISYDQWWLKFDISITEQ